MTASVGSAARSHFLRSLGFLLSAAGAGGVDVDFLSAFFSLLFVWGAAGRAAEGGSSERSGSTIPAHKSSRGDHLPGEDNMMFLRRSIVPPAVDLAPAGYVSIYSILTGQGN